MLVFVGASLLLTMSHDQTTSIEVGSLQYWLFIVPALLLPLLDVKAIIATLRGPARLLLVMLLTAGAWHLLRGDARAVAQLILLVFVLAWVSTPDARIEVDDLVALYVALILVGMGVTAFTDFSPYSLVPGRTDEDFGAGRVSFFPNIAYTGILSLALLLVLTKDRATARAHPIVLLVALYFLVFSFVRTATIGFVLYVAMRFLLRRVRRPSEARMFWLALGVGLGATVLIGSSAALIEALQDLPFVPELLLQGKSDLSAEDIFKQMYRPWLWFQHLDLFVTSPWLMGLGSFDFFDLKEFEVFEIGQSVSTGSESLPTRLLAVYGLAGALFTLYLFTRLRALARAGDHWACACFPAIFLLLMNWGGVFHPTEGMFVILLLMIVRGSDGYVSHGRVPLKRARTSGAARHEQPERR